SLTARGGDLTFNNLRAAGSTVTLSAAGDVSELPRNYILIASPNPFGPPPASVTADALAVLGTRGVRLLHTSVNTFAARAGTDGGRLINSGGLTIGTVGTVSGITSGEVVLVVANAPVGSLFPPGAGNVSPAPLTVAAAVQSSGDISLLAQAYYTKPGTTLTV